MIDTAAAELLIREAIGSELFEGLQFTEQDNKDRPKSPDFRGYRSGEVVSYRLNEEDARLVDSVVQLIGQKRIAGYVHGPSPFDGMVGGKLAGKKQVAQTREEIFGEFGGEK